MGTGLGHYIPIVAYIGFWVMCVVSLTGRPLLGLYYMMPFVPYRTMRDHFDKYPLGSNMLTILLFSVIVGALLQGKRLPKSKLYLVWLIFAVYLYFSMWLGSLIGNAPSPVWLSDLNFLTWKDYMVMPLLFCAAGLVVQDRKAVRNIILITGFSLLIVDRSALAESLSHSWGSFDEEKRSSGPLAYGVNQLAAFLAQFAMFFWGFVQFMKRKMVKAGFYLLIALTLFTTMYTFSRGAYVAVVVSAVLLGVLKDRKLLLVIGLFLFTWQTVVPVAVTERVSGTTDANSVLDQSAQERVRLWKQSQELFLSSPILGTGFATFQYGQHTDALKDTHNWFVKVLVETGIIGGIIALAMLTLMVGLGYRLFRRGKDPLYRGLGLGFLLAVCSCIIANLFGDRWTYVEINGLLWILAGVAARSEQMAYAEPPALESQSHTLPALSGRSLAPHLEWSRGAR